MAWTKYFDFTDASMKGDLRWAKASKWTGFAAYVVMTLLVLSIIQIVLGVLVVVGKDSDLTFGGVIQLLIVPGLSFFNAVPSAHLHILARSNVPKMAMCFSIPLSVIYLASAIVYFASGCFDSSALNDPGNPNKHVSGLHKNECPTVSTQTTWEILVALQLLSGVLYAIHASMAAKVHLYYKKRARDVAAGTVVEEVDLEAKTRREQEARDRWQRIVDL